MLPKFSKRNMAILSYVWNWSLFILNKEYGRVACWNTQMRSMWKDIVLLNDLHRNTGTYWALNNSWTLECLAFVCNSKTVSQNCLWVVQLERRQGFIGAWPFWNLWSNTVSVLCAEEGGGVSASWGKTSTRTPNANHQTVLAEGKAARMYNYFVD